MPKPVPDVIATLMHQKAPDYKLWWIEGLLVKNNSIFGTINVPQGEKIPYLKWLSLNVVEVDSPTEGARHEALLSADYTYAEMVEGDRVSLLGHVKANYRSIGFISYLYNHDTDEFYEQGLGYPEGRVVCGRPTTPPTNHLTAIIGPHPIRALMYGSHRDYDATLVGQPGYIGDVYQAMFAWLSENGAHGENYRASLQREALRLDF